jgi:hypothetical protein
MTAHQFTDSVGDTYSVEILSSETMMLAVEDKNVRDFVAFHVKDAVRIATMILVAAQEAAK